MLQNIKPFGLAMFSGDIWESINRFVKHGQNEHINRGGGLSGGGGGRGVGSSVVGHPQGGQCASTVHDMVVCILVSWVVHGGPWSQVPCSGRDAMEVRRGQGHMQASLNQTISQDGIARVGGRAAKAGICRAVRSRGDLGNRSSLDLGSTIGR